MIAVQITPHFPEVPADLAKLKKLVRAVCQRFGVARATVGIGIVDDAEIRVLNRRFLNHEGTTDCLSFDLSDGTDQQRKKRGHSTFPSGPKNRRIRQAGAGKVECPLFSEEPRVFELVVNGALAVREAARRGHGAEAELALYIVHGLLHQLGFDDATVTQAQEMHRTEDEILQHLSYGLVYNSREARAP